MVPKTPAPLGRAPSKATARYPFRQNQPFRLFHTAKNTHHDMHSADYAISYDLAISSQRHFQLPYWMEMIVCSHECIAGNTNPR